MEKQMSNWWDKLGTPQYGGEMVVRSARNIVNFDPYNGAHLTEIYGAWLERLCAGDATIDPAVFSYQTMAPPHLLRGHLAESWGIDPRPVHSGFPSPQRHPLAKSAAGKWTRVYG